MKCSLIFYVRIIQKECINTTNFKVILIHLYFNTNSVYIKYLIGINTTIAIGKAGGNHIMNLNCFFM